jgi:hypothetical protein
VSGHGWTLAEWGSVASFLSLIGLIPVFYNAFLQLNDRRMARRTRVIRSARAKDWHLIRPNYDQRMARVEDVMACQEVFAKLNSMGMKVTVGGDDQTHPRDSNLVIICGPKSNKIAAQLLREVDLPFEVVDNVDGWGFRDKKAYQVYKSPMDSGHQADIALFGKVTDHAGNTCYLLWGIHGAGTVGAARGFVNDHFLENAWKRSKGSDFVGIIYIGFTSLDDIEVLRWLAEPVRV